MNTRSLLSGALTAYKNKKYAIALLAFRQLLALEPRPGLLINIAVIEMRLDMLKEAMEDVQEALKSDALTPEERGRAIAAHGAIEKLENANAVGFLALPSNVDTESSPMAKDPRAIRHQVQSLYRSAEGAAKSEDYEGAFNAFKTAQERLPNAVNLINMGKILVMLQRYSEASSMFERALHDRTIPSPIRKVAEAELEASKRFQGMRLDYMGDPPPLA
jgi:tetratricopeptide (TPR) repeat protein